MSFFVFMICGSLWELHADGCDAGRLGELGDPKEGPTTSFEAFVDYSTQGAGPATHKCLQKFYFS